MKGGCFISYGELKQVRDVVVSYWLMVEKAVEASALSGTASEADIEAIHIERMRAQRALSIIEKVKE